MEFKRKILFKTRGKNYELSFPTVGEYKQIEVMKAGLSNGLYGDMIKSGTVFAIKALDLIDMQSTLSVLCPDLISDLKVNSFDELDMADALDLLKSYQEQVSSWVGSWMQLFKSPPVVDDEKKPSESEG